MDVAALSTAILSLILAVVALTWQVVQHLLTGSRLKVTSGSAFFPGSADPSTYLTVTAANVGRTAVTVYGYGFDVGDGQLINLDPPPHCPPVPQRIEPGAEVTFFFNRNGVEVTMNERHLTYENLRPFVRSAGSRTWKGAALK